MAKESASSVTNADVLASLKSLQDQLQEHRKVQVSILQQLSAVQQARITSHTPDDSGPTPTASVEELLYCIELSRLYSIVISRYLR